MSVLDASAVLAFLQGEPGGEAVEHELRTGTPVCGAANWSEVAQKVRQRGGDWDLARALLLGYGISIEPVGIADAERAADRWVQRADLSLGDRLCLALADRLEVQAITADAAWGVAPNFVQIRAEDRS